MSNGISLPYTFANGTVADASQLDADLAVLLAGLNRALLYGTGDFAMNGATFTGLRQATQSGQPVTFDQLLGLTVGKYPLFGNTYAYTAPPAVPAGVPSGQGYWMPNLPSSPNALIFMVNVGGVATPQPNIFINPQQSVIFCNTVSDNGLKTVIQIPFAGINVPATLYGVSFRYRQLTAKLVGSPELVLLDINGVTLLDATIYGKNDDNSLTLYSAGAYGANDINEVRRSSVTNVWTLQTATDVVTPNLSLISQDEIFPRELVSTGRTVACNKISGFNYKVRVKPNTATMYKGAQRARQGDEATLILRNLAADQSINTAFDLNSITGHFKQTEHQLANFMFDHLAANVTTDTGLVASTFSTVAVIGKSGGPYSLTGRNHGQQGNGTGTLIGTQNDPGSGTVTSGDLSGLPIGPIWKGTKLQLNTANSMLFPDLTVAGSNSMVLTFESGTDHLYQMSATLDFTAATATPYLSSGYCQMMPMRDIDTLVPIYGYGTGTQATGAPITGCDAGDGAQVNFPVDGTGRYPDAVCGFNSDNPLVKLICACGFASGYAYAINGTPVARDATSPVFFIRNTYGPKLYFAFGFNASPISVAGQIWTFKANYYILVSDATIYV